MDDIKKNIELKKATKKMIGWIVISMIWGLICNYIFIIYNWWSI